MGRTAASLAIAAELTLAVALLLGWWPLLLRRVGICCFALFAIVSAYKLIIGERSCGCFGSLHVPPAVTFALDCVMVAAFAVCRPPAEERKPISMRKALIAGSAALTVMIAVAVAVTFGREALLARAGGSVRVGGVVILEPEKWVGRAFPLLSEIDVAGELSRGRWEVLLYHHDCPACREAIARYQAKQRAKDEAKVALIELPPYAPAGESAVSESSQFVLGKLSDRQEWFVTTPAVISLRDGVVTSASQGEQVKLAALQN